MAFLPYPRHPPRGCSCPSCTNQAIVSSHRTHRIHGSFWQRIFSHRFHRCSQIRRVWHLAIPTPPSANSPTEFTEFTEASSVEEPPTDFTDAHRWLGCVGFSHRIHRIHRNFWRRIFSHRFHRCSQMVRLRRVLPQNSRNSQKFLA